jgi:thiamine monophosphate kinase
MTTRSNAHGSITFTASDGREYEIRHTADASQVKLRVFRDNLPVNRFCYTTTFETADEFAFATGGNVVDQLIHKAKLDLERDISLN